MLRPWISILISTAASMAIWWVWHAKGVFRDRWLVSNRITQAKIDVQVESGIGSTIIATALTYLVISIGIHYWLDATGSKSLWRALGNAFVLWALIVVPIVFLDLLWEFRRLDSTVLDSSHLLVVLLSITVIANRFKRSI